MNMLHSLSPCPYVAGDLYSVKIMWPRTAEERSRNRHTGFVCYMNRADAEDAMKTCNETDPFNVGRKITMRWGKNVRHNNNTVAPIPRAPRRIPHRSQAETTTVATSADTTNAIRVTVPRNPQRAKFLSTVASFVAKDGVAAENYLLRQEAKNPDFKFLLYETSDSETVRQEHIYYRWRVYSFSQGDSREVWRTEPFRMARKGRFWIPPPLDGALQLEHQASQEDRRLEQDSQRRRRRRNTPADGQDSLSQADHLQLVVLTRKKLCASRDAICNAMAFCLEHSGACGEICSFLKSLLLEDKCSVDTRVSRLYLISDILFNSQQPGIKNAFRYRDAVEKMAPDVFTSLGQHGRNSKNLGRMTLNKLNNAVTAVLGAWARWSVYNPMFLEELDARFHGREIVKEAPPEDAIKEEEPEEANKAEPPPPIILDRPRGDWTEVNDDEEEEQGHKEESSQLVPTETKEGAKDESPVSEDAQKVADGDSGKDSQNKKESSEDSATEPKPAATDEELDDDIDGVPIEDGDLDEEGLKALETIQETLKRWAEDGEVLPEEPEEEDDGGTVNVHPADGAKPPHETAQGELASSVTPEDSKPAPTSHPADSVETTAGVL